MEIGLAVGGAFLSSGLNVIFDHLAPQGNWLKHFKTRNHELGVFKKLRRTLLGLQAVLEDAENKQTSNRYVKEWLAEVQDAVEHAENLVEEINYQVLKLKVEARHQQLSDQFLDSIMPRVEESIATLKDLQEQVGELGLLGSAASGKQETPKRLPTTSVVDESDVFGRKDEKEQLVSRVLLPIDEDGEKPYVIPVIGMGGIGKTTLAKVVYNDPRVQSHFDLKAWICVSEPYDAFKITKGALGEIIGSLDSIAEDSQNQIEIKLKEQIKGKRFLFVLDDIWNDNYVDWVDLKSLFSHGEIGSKVIVTARKDSVSSMMSSDEPIHLKILSSEESWSLFERHAFKNKALREHPEFQEVGKEIVGKCKGLPLALKAIGGLLRVKPGIEEWRRVLRSDVWAQSVFSSRNILPALQLSYNDLPQHLKCCFAFCAIFPKDYSFDRDCVVQLWIANGLVQQDQTDETIDELGNQCFLELLSRSLFQKQGAKFVMHDLVNDLAQQVCSKLCLWLENLQCFRSLERARHLSFHMSNNEILRNLSSLTDLEQLRTLLPVDLFSHSPHLNKTVLHNILPKLVSLRALSLSHYWISGLPNALFIKLNMLRYLDLSHTHLRELPDSTCVLYNLQTLLLSHCQNLRVLPLDIENLISLRYLDIRGTPLSKPHARKLKLINVLLGAKFFIGNCDGTGIEELGDFHNLHRSLSISQLQNVGDGNEAMKAGLADKEHIEELSMRWHDVEASDSQTEREILDKLQPGRKLKVLEISGYRGTKFPNWISHQSFCKLEKLSLGNCKNCDSLPALGQLPSLKFINIKRMRVISKVSEEFYGNESSMVPFPSLVKLEFDDMPEWKEWHVLRKGEFPKLECLSIYRCPKLIVELPENLHSLRFLSFRRIGEFRNLKTGQLEKQKISGGKNLGAAVMTSLGELHIFDCSSLIAFPQGGLVAPNLKKLVVESCSTLKSLPEHMHDLFQSLEILKIYKCPEIESFSEGGLPFGLEILEIGKCKKLVNCRKEWRLQELPRLRTLEIFHDGSDEGVLESWELPCTIRELRISKVRTLTCKTLERLNCLEILYVEDIPNIQLLLGKCVLLHLASLQHLIINNCPQLQSLPGAGLPSSLAELSIYSCFQLQSLPENGLPFSLSILDISNCPQLQSLPEKGLPSSLSELSIHNCMQFQSLPEKGLPSSLSSLRIRHCPQLQSLPEKGLPSSLSTMSIRFCDQLQHLPEKGLPASLSELYISHCPLLESIPEIELPSSISKLSIDGCPLLQSRLEFEKGAEWPKIAHVPTIFIDNELI